MSLRRNLDSPEARKELLPPSCPSEGWEKPPLSMEPRGSPLFSQEGSVGTYSLPFYGSRVKYNGLLISDVKQSDSVIHMYIYTYSLSYSFPLWFIAGY